MLRAKPGGSGYPQNPSTSSYRWVMLGAICALYWSFGVVQGTLPPLVGPVSSDLHMSRLDMGIVLGSWQFVYLFVAILAGVLLDRFGLRRALLFAGAVIAVSQLLRGAALNHYMLLGAVMLFGLGGPFVSAGAPKLVSMWFGPTQMGLALAIYTSSSSVGTFLALSTSNSVVMPLTGQSWRLTTTVFGCLTVLTVVAWLVLARDPRPRHQEHAAANRSESMFTSSKVLWRMSFVRILLFAAIAAFLYSHSVRSWLPQILETRGMTPSEAGFWASVPTLVGIAVSLFLIRLIRDKWLLNVLPPVFVAGAVATTLIGFASGLGLYAGLVLLGAVNVIAVSLLMLVLLRSIDSRLVGAAAGLFFAFGEIGGMTGPPLTGALAGHGDFRGALVMLSLVSCLLAGLCLWLRAAPRPRLAPIPPVDAPA
jgi:cyanate permease